MRTVVRDPLTMAIEASLRDLQRDESKMEQEEGGEEEEMEEMEEMEMDIFVRLSCNEALQRRRVPLGSIGILRVP